MDEVVSDSRGSHRPASAGCCAGLTASACLYRLLSFIQSIASKARSFAGVLRCVRTPGLDGIRRCAIRHAKTPYRVRGRIDDDVISINVQICVALARYAPRSGKPTLPQTTGITKNEFAALGSFVVFLHPTGTDASAAQLSGVIRCSMW